MQSFSALALVDTFHTSMSAWHRSLDIRDYSDTTIPLTNACHMVYLPYGIERTNNDGRRFKTASQGAWLESFQENARRKGIPLCSEVEKGRGVYHLKGQTSLHHSTVCHRENQQRGVVRRQKRLDPPILLWRDG